MATVVAALTENAWPLVTVFALLVLRPLARTATGIICAEAAYRWIRTRDLPEDKRQELITAAARRYLHLRDPQSQPGSSPDPGGSGDTSVI